MKNKDIISVQGIIPFLTQKELSENIHIYDVLGSTNETAKQMAASQAQHCTVVIADAQTAGKGRYGKAFYSPPGHGIYMSIVFCPDRLPFDDPTRMTTFTAASVCQAIEAVSDKKPHIKPPNDVYLGDKKICGILTETVIGASSGTMQQMVVGIGINFSMPESGFPLELEQIAGALFAEESPPITRNRLIAEVINRMLAAQRG